MKVLSTALRALTAAVLAVPIALTAAQSPAAAIGPDTCKRF